MEDKEREIVEDEDVWILLAGQQHHHKLKAAWSPSLKSQLTA